MTAPNIGYQSTYPADNIVTAKGGDFSKGGFCSVSADADANVFPLNKVVRFTSTDATYLRALGTGDLAAAVTGLNDQLGGSGCDLMVVRVAEGANADPVQKLAETQANIIGNAGDRSGLWALRGAPRSVGARPGLVWAGMTYQEGVGGADNPVRAALAPHLEAMRAISIVDVAAGTKEKAIAARGLMSSKRMMPLGIAAKVYENVGGAATLVTRPMAPRILGLIVQTDNNYRQGMPFDSFCNKPVLGLADISRPIEFDIGDGSTEAQLMLASDVAVVVAGQTADTGAIADGGFVFLGVESAAIDDTWSQIHQVRGADYIDLEFRQIARQYLGGRYTMRRAESVLKSFGLMLDDHVANEDILGYELSFPAALNSIAQVMKGQFSIRTRVEQAPVIRVINNEVRRYPEALSALVAAINAAVGTQSAVVS